jgi:HEAT repeat protein
MRKRTKSWLAFLVGVPLVVFAAAMLDPFFRQLVFGPKYGGFPLVSWQAFFREWDVADPGAARQSPSFLDNVHDAVLRKPHPGDWKKLSGEDRRAILLTVADDPKEVVRIHVAAHLGEVPPSPEVVARLQRYTREEADRVREYAALALGQLDPPPTEMLPDLLRLLEDPEERVRRNAAGAVARLGSRAPGDVLPKVLPLLKTSGREARLLVLDALGRMKPAPREAVPAVREALKDPDWRVRAEALRALGFLKAKEAVPQVVAALRDPEQEVRRSAAYAVRNIGPDAKEAIPVLVERVRSLDAREPIFSVPELEALGSMGAAAGDVVPELLPLRRHESEVVRREVEKALTQIDPQRFPPKK